MTYLTRGVQNWFGFFVFLFRFKEQILPNNNIYPIKIQFNRWGFQKREVPIEENAWLNLWREILNAFFSGDQK